MEAADPFTSTDPLAEALHGLRTDGAFYCRSELTGPWGLEMPTMKGCVWFHAVTSGRCFLQGEDGESIEVMPGDFVLVPHGRGHDIRSGDDVATELVTELPQAHISERYSRLEYGGGGDLTILVCGVVRLQTPFVADLGSLLPPLIHLRAGSAQQTEWVSGTLRLLASEAQTLRPGGETVLTRLADILVIQSIRAWLESNAQQRSGLLAAINDPQIGKALMHVHRDPTESFSVETLAAVAAMSRSGFAARFRQLMGEAPMHYVTRLRMRAVQGILAEGKTTVAELADRFGYRSTAAFNRAFKRCVGVSPGAVRRGARQS